ncbi:MAG: hemolysin family protein, partial [Candidatus Hinthialibacter sp.]
ANITDQILSQWFDLSNPYAFGSALAVGVTTFLLLVFGEIVPKTYCKEHAVRVSQLVIGPLDFIYKILRPFISFFVFISNLFISLMGSSKIKEVPLLTEDDVRTLIELSEKEGVLEEEEREMIHSIIDFGDTLVKEIMTPRVDFHVIPVNLTMEEVRREAVSQGHSRIPVYEEDPDQIIGILYVKDLLNEQNGGEHFNLKKMLRPALFVPKSKRVIDLLETFRKEKNHMAIVVDEYGTTAGLVTIEDVLEEIVGDIQDEYDEEPPEYERQEDGSIEADAKINLDILTEILDIEFPEDDVESLGGFMISVLGDVPPVGAQVDYSNHRFTVMDADERRINRVKIEQHSNQEEKNETAYPPPAPENEQHSPNGV